MSTDVTLLPIAVEDVDRVARFLSTHLNPAVPPATWTSGIRAPWGQGPDHGYMLITDEGIVGANLAFRSVRRIDGRTEQVCNLGALVRACRRTGSTPRDSSGPSSRLPGPPTPISPPSGNVVAINERLKMSALDVRTRLLPNLPAVRSKRVTMSTQDRDLLEHLGGEELTVYQDHALSPAVRHLLLSVDDQSCHIMWRHDRRKKVRAFATIVHVSNRDLFRAHTRQVLSHLLLVEHVPFTLLEDRVATAEAPGRYWTTQRPKMFKSSSLEPDQIDYLYSELTQIPW